MPSIDFAKVPAAELLRVAGDIEALTTELAKANKKGTTP